MSPEASEPTFSKVFQTSVFDKVEEFLARFVAFPSEHALTAVTLWVFHAHAVKAFESTPRLALISAEKGSGKTRTLEVLDLLVPNPMHAVNLSAAALFRQVSSKTVTLLLDEADTYLGPRVAKDHEELRGLINAGHRRGAVAYRCVGEPSKMQVQEFPAFCAVALAGIGDLPDTIIDRSIVVKMRRRRPDEYVEPFRLRKVKGEAERLFSAISEWVDEHFETLKEIEPEMPEGIVDRPADVWEALLSVAHVAGPEWRAKAEDACTGLNSERVKADTSLGVQLLTDVRAIFETLGLDVDRIGSQDLADKLCDLEESPWGDLRGRSIDPRGVARRLRRYDVRPTDLKIDDRTVKGYYRADFADAWARYLPPLPPSGKGNEGNESDESTADGAPVADVALSSGMERRESKTVSCRECGEPTFAEDRLCGPCRPADDNPLLRQIREARDAS